MAHVKKLVVQGFKSFAKKTELPFTPGINVILGPNGSGKSNVSDALCFVLGRLSIKSMRAAKAKNLIFLGTKAANPSKEAVVEIIFDNHDKTFSIDTKEISIKRIVRKNGQSIYKINNETKTRQEVLSLLAQAGIDPNGFNIILQGEIQNFVKMQTEERRKIIEEVSGISIYESRKDKSLKELNKTEEKLKEVLAVLRERTSYLNNLERERQQALRFKKLESDVKKFKASIIYNDLIKKKKQAENINLEIDKRNKSIEKIKKSVLAVKIEISNFENKINSLNSIMQKSSGLEQEKLNQEIANIRADLAGLLVKLENSEKKINNLAKQKQELSELIRNNELSIKELQKESPTITNKEKELSIKKKELEKLEEQRKRFYMVKSELKSISARFEDKKSVLQNYSNESDFLIKQIESLTKELFDKNTNEKKLQELKHFLIEKKELLSQLSKKEIEIEKLIHTNEYEINKQKKIIENIAKIDTCPLCKNNITKEHIFSIKKEASPKINFIEKEMQDSNKNLIEIRKKRKSLKEQIEQFSNEVSKRESDLIKISNINEKKEQIKFLREKQENTKTEFEELSKRKKFLEKNFDENSNIEHKYETLKIEVQEISIRSEENVNSEILFKQKEFQRAKISLKQLKRDEEDFLEEIILTKKNIKDKETLLLKKKKQNEELNKKFQKLIQEKDAFQKKINESESNLLTKQNEIYGFDQKINNLKIDKARIDAEIENLEIEILEFPNIEIIKMNKELLIQKLNKTQEILSNIGSVNLRSLEVYDTIKKEYDTIKEKVDLISKEKESILRVIHQIDIQKKKSFLKTLTELNNIFSRNFAQISTKGQVSLELENRKNPFEGGVQIIVKTGHGKYFDVTSLSGGEQTMVALSLIFAIQEFKPYCFYILDEIDAALDKRNSERLASLLQKYMQKGQYIVITHNDEIITNATNLYGVSMHEGVSKVISMKI
ncbi:chromosome segregation SMC family protein [Nanoarchaeota archaeon]